MLVWAFVPVMWDSRQLAVVRGIVKTDDAALLPIHQVEPVA